MSLSDITGPLFERVKAIKRLASGLQRWARENHRLDFMKPETTVPEYNLVFTVGLEGQSLEDFLIESLPDIIRFLPDSVVVVDRQALESLLAMTVPDAGGRADPEVGRILTQTLEGNAAISIAARARIIFTKRTHRS